MWLPWPMRIIKFYDCMKKVIFLSILFVSFLNIPAMPQKLEFDTIKPFPESHFVEIDSFVIHYRMWQDSSVKKKGKILMIHGLGGSTFSWRKNIKSHTAAGYLLVAADLPAFGFSSRKKGFNHSAKNRAITMFTLLDSIDRDSEINQISEQWILMGHSMGASVISEMAMLKSDRIESLVFVDGAVFTDTTKNTNANIFSFPLIKLGIGVYLKTSVFTYNGVRKFLGSAYGSEPNNDDVEGYLKPFKLKGTISALFELLNVKQDSSNLNFESILIPTLLIWGEKDTWIPVSQGNLLKEKLKNSELFIIPNAAHCPMETHSEIFNKELIRFLNSLKR